jgi:hypothetical protein
VSVTVQSVTVQMVSDVFVTVPMVSDMLVTAPMMSSVGRITTDSHARQDGGHSE